MSDEIMFARFSLLHPRMIIAVTHFAFGLVCLLRINLSELFRAYVPFANMGAWGVGLIALAFVLTFAPRASLLLMTAQLVSATAFFIIVGLLTLGVGLLPTAATISVLGCTSLLLFFRSFRQWLDTQLWYLNRRARAPRWLERTRVFRWLRQRFGRDG
ncbi:hypothetical protein [Deinococcus ruber]|uniref:Uncharacterized protein n=1 Tax=Deinococcus ruber TaxID=1848197 RepID=A0A918F8T6_9DEIO|nr:hypothetical protein [Deinococcus ruber]GGR11330.1 hypothetical protein GCM10008957_25060 [Deinococcus ruber]